MIHSFNKIRVFIKNIKYFFSNIKNTLLYVKPIFEHIRTNWQIFLFSVAGKYLGHMTLHITVHALVLLT